MFLSFLSIHVFDIPQLLYALIYGTAPPVSGPPPAPVVPPTTGNTVPPTPGTTGPTPGSTGPGTTGPGTTGPGTTGPGTTGPGTTGPGTTGPGTTDPGTTVPESGGQQSDTSTPESTVGAEIQPIKPISRFFALIIGINEYKSPGVKNLLGAVPDADNVKEYLEKELRVPSTQIRNLRDSEATRARILHEINAFINDKRIEKGDAIFIFYAGHGADAPSPPRWQARGPKIQLLVPYDHECIDGNGRKVFGVPDRTLGALLTRLAIEKGDNITVIFDCCHSGSGTRTDKAEPTRLVRGIEIKEAPADDLDQDIWGAVEAKNDRAIAPATGFAQSGLLSHVLLAACGADELAREENKQGVFTSALIEALKFGAHKLTYAELLQRLPPLSTQNPQCEGANQNRILFNAKVAGQRAVLYKIRKEGDHYKMEAGEAHGLSVSAQFAVYKDRDSFLNDSPSLGTVIARELAPFATTLDASPKESAFEVGDKAIAIQTKAGAEEDLRIHVAMDEKLVVVFQALSKEMQRTDPARRSILLVENGAELDIGLEGGRLVFNVLHAETRTLGVTRLWKSVEPTVDAVTPVISAAAHYFWHLRRKSAKQILQKMVKVEFFEVAQSDEEFDAFLQPVVRRVGKNLITNNVIDLQVKDGAKYGMEITNSLKVPLYVSLFYFDSSALEITSWYEPPTAKGVVDPSVLGERTLPIGFGDSGTIPYRLYFREPDQTLDVGFFKLFLSTEYVNLSHVAQRSPFDKSRPFTPDPIKPPAIWDTILIPIRQRRGF
ncbi:hypothetical protein BV22DRAFT_1131900 [Leucogyrophana mollusca]|uniref:Uncharacterized protein n=1 Tax=Leucogyrophana mollusca TaxID=85980 RepID=A0ACB8B9B2_9AGAM|nr:hypothetical protein BV22DRAFT_1131900 [Leucogyrophana mollusca]